MPRPRQKEALFELDGQRIGHELGKPYLYRYYHDERTGHSCRRSLGTSNLEEAKCRLAEIVVKGAPKNDDTYLSIVLDTYYEAVTDHLPSAKPARHAGHLALEIWGSLVTVGGITEEQNKKFVKVCLKRGHAISYISRNLGVIAVAINRAKLHCDLIYGESKILATWPEFKPKPAKEIYEPTDEELARLLRAETPQNFRRWLLMSMATVGRPEAVLDLTPEQRKQDIGLLDLNPAGRRQNKKWRATVREIPSLSKLLDEWEAEDREISRKERKKMAAQYCRYSHVDSLDTAIHRLRHRKDINIPLFSSYSIRHRATSVLRAAKVPGEQVSFQLGHKRIVPQGESRTTRGYGHLPPDYLEESAAALEAWIKRVMKLADAKPVRKLGRAA